MRLIALLAFSFTLAALVKDVNEDLLSASRAGDLAAVKSSLESGAVLETKTSYGQTPLYLAAMNGHDDVVRFLLEKGARTDIQDTFYKAPMLAFVLQRKHWETAKLLVSKSTNPDQSLQDVAGTGRSDLVQAVLSNFKPSQTALDKALENALDRQQTEIVTMLKKAGANDPAPAVVVDDAVLQSYIGTFKSDEVPLDIQVSTRGGRLYLQATGQPELATKALSPTRFAFAPARLEVEFSSADAFILKQGGGAFKFKKGASK